MELLFKSWVANKSKTHAYLDYTFEAILDSQISKSVPGVYGLSKFYIFVKILSMVIP